MKQTHLNLFFLAAALLCLFTCAQQGTLSGGDKDTTAPQVDSTKTTRNFQTNFQKQDIEITFKEWIQLNDLQKQLVVSPPLEFAPKVSLSKRTVRFEFDDKEILKDSTTYVVNFGNAIGDLTENNKVPEMRYVLSTGDYIDSLVVMGKVLDVEQNDAAENVTVMLYDNLADSVVRTERPYYFAKTDKSGSFKIENIKAGTFKVVALQEKNNNYLFDGGDEKIGFPEGPVVIGDSIVNEIKLTVFQEAKILKITEKQLRKFGSVKLVFNSPTEGLDVAYDKTIPTVYFQTDKDSLLFWYDLTTDTLDWNIYLRKDSTLNDTILVKIIQDSLFKKSARLKALRSTSAEMTLKPASSFLLKFNFPIYILDTSRIIIFEDTLRTPIPKVVLVDTLDKRKLVFNPKWQEGLPYEIMLLPNTVEDLYGLKNQDTIIRKLKVLSEKDLAVLDLTISGLNPAYNYVSELIFMKKTIDTFTYSGDTTYQKSFILLPGKYSVKTVEDTNNNNRWDTGNYDRKTQPETIFNTDIDQELRANWTQENSIRLERQRN